MPDQTQIKYLEEPPTGIRGRISPHKHARSMAESNAGKQISRRQNVMARYRTRVRIPMFSNTSVRRATPERKTGPVEMRLSGRMESNATREDGTRTRSSLVVVLSIADEKTEKISRSFGHDMEERRTRDGAMGDEHSVNASGDVRARERPKKERSDVIRRVPSGVLMTAWRIVWGENICLGWMVIRIEKKSEKRK